MGNVIRDSTPDSEADKLSRLQQEVKNGKYKTSSQEIAMSLIRSHLLAALAAECEKE